jgi:tripartite-type tricarboxylate transporter receptor subunit TctC
MIFYSLTTTNPKKGVRAMSKRNWTLVGLGFLVIFPIMALAASTGADTQAAAPFNYPTKPIQMIIPWPAGGATDLASRLMASHAEKLLGRPIMPINKDGANGASGWAEAVDSRPDGYTISVVTFDILTNQALGRSIVKYSDLDYLLQFTSQPMAIAVNFDSPHKSLNDLIQAAKASPSTLTVATTPLGGIYHQLLAMVEKKAGVKFRVVPFPGSAEVNTAILGKHVDAQINTLTLLHQYVKADKMRILAVSSENRNLLFPDSPTLMELNYNIAYESFRAIGVPKNLPPQIKVKLMEVFTKAYNSPEFQEAAIKGKFDPYFRNSEDLGNFLNKLYPAVQGVLVDVGMKK